MRWLLLLLLLLAGCSKGAEADLPTIGSARSLGAEWALVNEQQGKGQLTPTYGGTMRGRLRQQLETDLGALTQPRSAYADEIRALAAEPDDTTPARLRAHVDALKRIEDNLESA